MNYMVYTDCTVYLLYLFSDFTKMQTRERWHEKKKRKRKTVEGQHHRCGAAQLC